MGKKKDLLRTIKAHKAVCDLLSSSFLSDGTLRNVVELKGLLEADVAERSGQPAEKPNRLQPIADGGVKILRITRKGRPRPQKTE